MAENDNAVLTAAKGYIFTAAVGTPAPTPAQIDAFDPATTGNEEQTVAITGAPTGGSFTLTFGAQTTAAIAYNATAATVKAALEALSTIGSGGVTVTGGPLPASAVVVNFGGVNAGTDVALMTATASLTGGTTPAVAVTETKAAWAFSSVGHTSRDDLPSFGFEGGESETKGTWQNPSLRSVTSEAPVDSVTFTLSQLDEAGLELYYGVANASATAGVFSVADAPTTSREKSLLIIIKDGDVAIGFHASKASVKRDGEIELATDDFVGLPVKATLLKNSTDDLFSWISLATGVNPA